MMFDDNLPDIRVFVVIADLTSKTHPFKLLALNLVPYENVDAEATKKLTPIQAKLHWIGAQF